jgi:cardiolipin synthase
MPTTPLRRLLPPQFPWRGGNQFTLLIDGEQFFPRMVSVMAQAQRSIAIEMYLCSSGEIFTRVREALIAAVQRGVQVRLLFDHFGSLQLNNNDRSLLIQHGIEMRFYNRLRWRKGLSNLFRNHRKLLVVDGEVAFTGGAGFTDEFLHGIGNQPVWHEMMVEIRGPVVADWSLLFDRTWAGLYQALRKHQRISNKQIQSQLPAQGRVVASNGPQAHHVLQSLHAQLDRARTRAWLVTPYFVPSWKLRRRLTQAAKRGVDTRVLVPGHLTDHPSIRHASRRHYARLLQLGVRIFEYQPRFIHAKLAVCDDWVTIGSTNFDHWNLHWNLDANQEVRDTDLTAAVLRVLAKDFAASRELHYAIWLQRRWYLRLLEWLTGKLDRWLDSLR